MNKQVIVNSPAGSGNIFCMYMLRKYLEVDTVGKNHNPYAFEKSKLNLFLLRNPYDCIASGIEIFMLDQNLDGQTDILKLIDGNFNHYVSFMAESKRDYVVGHTFEFLTKTPAKFLESVSKEMHLKFKDGYAGEVDSQMLLSKLDSFTDHSRKPRPKSELRLRIDEVVSELNKIKNIYDEYLEYRDILQSTEI